MLINERKREFAILRVFGVSRRSLAGSVWSEILLICLTGALAGSAAAALVTLPFSGALRSRLDMPMLSPGIGTILLYLLLAVLICAAAGTLSSFWNVSRVSRADISLALRQER